LLLLAAERQPFIVEQRIHSHERIRHDVSLTMIRIGGGRPRHGWSLRRLESQPSQLRHFRISSQASVASLCSQWPATNRPISLMARRKKQSDHYWGFTVGADKRIPVDAGKGPTRVGFLLFPNFILLSYAAVAEALRAANQVADADLYQWRNVTIDGRAARSLTGAEVPADCRVGDGIKFDLLFIASTNDFHPSKEVVAWLRRVARDGTQIAGISAGVHIMAEAGLLDGYRCAIHWSHAPSFRESFPNIEIESSLYVIDRKRITCSGSGAAADLMHAVIEAQHGAELARGVDEWLTLGLRPRTAPQRRSISERISHRSPPLISAVTHMEAHLEEHLTREDLARSAGVSVRQLERLFRLHLGTTIVSYYRQLRLNHARELLRRTGLSVGEIALASGFSSHSYFSRAFKAQFGFAPTARRYL
jgi:transcriptional regulator GlxA family with amidase domain